MDTDIVERLIAEAKKRGTQKRVLIEVGDLAEVPASVIKDQVSRKAGWDVEIASRRAIVQCLCGFFGEPRIVEKSDKGLFFICPSCGNSPGVVEGEEIILKEVF